MPRPTSDLDGCAAAHAALLERVAGLGEAAVRAPSALPGWTRAHVLVHIARNCDSMTRRLEGAARGETVDQYPGGAAGRAAEIEAGSVLGRDELVADVRSSIERFDHAVAAMDDVAWAVDTRSVGGSLQRADTLPSRRWHEVEVHHVDLDAGYSWRDWPDAFVTARLPGMLAERAAGVDVAGHDEREVLAWLYGRAQPAGLPELEPF